MASAVASKGPAQASLKKVLAEPSATATAAPVSVVYYPLCPAAASRGTAQASLKKVLAEPSATATGAPVSVLYYPLYPATATAARRLHNTQGKEVRSYVDDTSGREHVDADAGGRRGALDSDLSSFFSKDVLGLMEDTLAASGFTAGAPQRGWSVAKVDDDAVYLKVPMPGLGKEHVKVWAEQNSLVIKGEGEKEPWDGDNANAVVPKYSHRIELSADAFKMDKIKAEMKNGVLRVTVPKLKKEERKDVFQVTIE